MSKEIKIAGSISFGGKRLNVYGDLDAPLFKAKDISHGKIFLIISNRCIRGYRKKPRITVRTTT